jgi:hypothetical protein
MIYYNYIVIDYVYIYTCTYIYIIIICIHIWMHMYNAASHLVLQVCKTCVRSGDHSNRVLSLCIHKKYWTMNSKLVHLGALLVKLKHKMLIASYCIWVIFGYSEGPFGKA